MTAVVEAPDVDSLVEVIGPINHSRATKTATSSAQNSVSVNNLHPPDYLLVFRSHSRTAPDNDNQLERLIRRLDRVGLDVECRYGGKGSVLVFVRCPEVRMNRLVAKARYSSISTAYLNML